MAYDEQLAERVRWCLSGEPGISERRMFGGLAFLVDGAMAVAVSGSGGLMVRVDPDASSDLVERAGVARMVMHGREMKGWLLVDPELLADPDAVAPWVDRGAARARELGESPTG